MFPTTEPELRPSSTVRGYGYAWQRFRVWFIARHPICDYCKEQPTYDVHHEIPLRAGGKLLSEKDCRAACHSCHSRLQAKEKLEYPTGNRPPAKPQRIPAVFDPSRSS